MLTVRCSGRLGAGLPGGVSALRGVYTPLDPGADTPRTQRQTPPNNPLDPEADTPKTQRQTPPPDPEADTPPVNRMTDR